MKPSLILKKSIALSLSVIILVIFLTSCNDANGRAAGRFFENLFFVISSVMGLSSCLILFIISKTFSSKARTSDHQSLFLKISLAAIVGIGILLLVGLWLMITEWQYSYAYKRKGEMFYFVLGSYLGCIVFFFLSITSHRKAVGRK